MNLYKYLTLLLAVFGLLVLPVSADEEAEETTDICQLTLMVQYAETAGSDSLFEDQLWLNDGLSGGIESLLYQKTNDEGDILRVEGVGIIGQHQYELSLSLTDADGSVLSIGAENYRKFSDQDGWYGVDGSEDGAYALTEDLHLDIGKAWIAYMMPISDTLTLDLGYEYAWKKGRKNSVMFGRIEGIGSIGLYPSYKVIDEDWHTFKLGLTYEDDGLTIANQLIYEMYDGHYRNVDFVPADVDDTIDYDTGHVATEDYEFDHITYTLLLEKWLSDKTVLSAGYMFNWLDGDLEWMIDQVDFDMARHPHADYTDGPLDVDEYSHIFDLSLMSAPNNTVTYLVGLNAEFGKKRTDGDVFFVGHDSLPGYVESDVLYTKLEERLEVRLHVIPASVLYARAVFGQERWELQEMIIEDGSLDFAQDTDTDRTTQKYRVGINSHPMVGVSVGMYYQKKLKNDDLTSDVDTASAYSAYISNQKMNTDEFGLRLSLQHTDWLQTNYKYTIIEADVYTEFDSSPHHAHSGNIHSQAATVGAVLTCSEGAVFSTSLTYQESTTSVPAYPEAIVADNEPNTWLWTNNMTVSLDENNTLTFGYQYLETRNNQDAAAFDSGYNYTRHGATVGLRHRFSETLEGSLGYGFYNTQDQDRGDAGDYQAHLVTAGLTMTF